MSSAVHSDFINHSLRSYYQRPQVLAPAAVLPIQSVPASTLSERLDGVEDFVLADLYKLSSEF